MSEPGVTESLATLLSGLLAGEARRSLRQLSRAILFYAAAGLAALIGLAFLTGAAFIEVSQHYGRRDAALVFGAAFLILAASVYVLQRVLDRRGAQAARRRRREELALAAAAAGAALAPALLRGKGSLGLLAGLAYAIYRENSRKDGPPPPG